MSPSPGGFRQNEKMQHGLFNRRHLAIALLLALVAGVRVGAAETLSIEWDPNPEPEVVGYRVFVGPQPGVYTSQVDVGNATSYSLGAVEAGQRLCVAVAAYYAGPTVGNKSAEVCTDTNKPPVLQSPGNQTSAVGAALTLTLVGSDPEGLPVTYSATGLPAGLTLNRNTGFISGTPTTVTTYNVTVTVSDGVLSTSHALTWTVSASLPAAATLLRPSGTLASATPTFEWESVATATSYRVWVDDASSTDPRIQLDVTPAQAGCTSAGAVCRVSPGVALQAGRGSWSVRASNNSGPGPWSGAMDFTVADANAPTVTITTPTAAASYTTAATTIALGGTASDDAGISSVTWTNNLGGSGTATGTSTWTVASVPIKAGTNVITVTARDSGGNIATDVLTVTKNDGQSPTLTIASPGAVSSTSSATVAVTGTSNDDGAVTQVTWANDRGGNGTANGTNVWGVAAVALKPGANVITVTAHDGAGNKTSKSVTVSLTDGDSPTVVITAPVAGNTLSTSNATIPLGGTAADNMGVAQVTWSNNQGGGGVAAGTTSWTVAGVALKPGANVITVTAKDAAGNAATDVLTVTLTDGAAPEVSITTPTSGDTHTTAATSVTLGGTASDAFGIKEVRWTNDRGGSGLASGTTSWSVAAVALQPGVNVITVAAIDASGNVSRDRVAINVDGRAPTVSIATPAANSVTKAETVNLAGTSSDDRGVTQVTWTNNRGGGGRATGTTAWSVANAPLQTGVNVFTVVAEDGSGNRTSATVSVTREGPADVKAPVVRITGPSAESSFTTAVNSINLEGVASDDVAVTRVTWASDRGTSGVARGEDRWTVGSLTLLAGVNVITVTAFDAAGNSSTDVARITLDRGLPTISLTSPTTATSYTTSSSNVALTGVASDNGGTISRVKWSTDKGLAGDAVGTTSWAIPALTVALGTTKVTVTAYDNSGNAASVTLAIEYADTTKPTVKVYVPTTASSATTSSPNITVGGTAIDNMAVTEVTWATNRGASGTAYGSSSWTTPSIPLAAGATTVITITARDAAGNTAEAVISVTSTAKPTSGATGSPAPSLTTSSGF